MGETTNSMEIKTRIKPRIKKEKTIKKLWSREKLLKEREMEKRKKIGTKRRKNYKGFKIEIKKKEWLKLKEEKCS